MRRLVLVLVLGLIAVACETETILVQRIATSRVYFVEPTLKSQRLKDPELPVQAIQWKVQQAHLTVEGEGTLDLAFTDEKECQMTDTIAVNPTVAEGWCSGGVVVNASDEVRTATLEMTFSAELYRAKPLILPPGDDKDGDGVANIDDTCPLIANSDQDIGRCQLVLTGVTGFFSDSDADGVVDESDNCLWEKNNSGKDVQEINEDGPRTLGGVLFNSGIGKKCDLQSASVETAGDTEIQVTLGPITFLQTANQPTVFTVDMNIRESVSCDWDAKICAFDPDQLQFCINHSSSDAAFGCQN